MKGNWRTSVATALALSEFYRRSAYDFEPKPKPEQSQADKAHRLLEADEKRQRKNAKRLRAMGER